MATICPAMPQQGQASHRSVSSMPAGTPPIWVPFVSHRGDGGSEAEEVTGRVHNDWLFALELVIPHCYS